MEAKNDSQDTLTRLVCCIVAAVILYYAADKYAPQLHNPQLEQYLPWLRENKITAIAVAAAALFALSLLVLPPEKALPPRPEGPCDGYEPVEPCRP